MAQIIRCHWPECNEIKPYFLPQLKGWLKNTSIIGNTLYTYWFCSNHKEAAIKIRCNKCHFIYIKFPINTKNRGMCPKHERSWCAFCEIGKNDHKCRIPGCKEEASCKVFMDIFHKIWRELIINDATHWNDVLAEVNRESNNFANIHVGQDIWVAENLNIHTKESWYYDYEDSNKEFGQLYSPIAAKRACPDGWRLPSKADWENLIMHFGGNEIAGKNLKKGGASGFNATLAGRRANYDGSFAGLNGFGAYWCETGLEDNAGWAVSFRKDRDSIEFFRTSGVCFSVRYIKA